MVWGCVIARIMKFPFVPSIFPSQLWAIYTYKHALSIPKTWQIDCKNNQHFSLPLPPVIMWLSSSSHQEVELFPQPFSLGWPVDLFRPVECSRIEDVPVWGLVLKRFLAFSLGIPGLSYEQAQVSLLEMRDHSGKLVKAPQPAASLFLVKWERPAQISRATYPALTHH